MTSFTIPTIETEHLILRGPKASDFNAFAEFYASDRSKGVGGPLTRDKAWRAFATDFGHWHLLGYGMWVIDEKSSGKVVGHVGFWNPEGWLERELAWTVFEGFEGKGYAHEAALGARNYAYQTLGWGPMISVIDPDNTRSIVLAKRLGATHERDWDTPSGHPTLIYRHPAPEAMS